MWRSKAISGLTKRLGSSPRTLPSFLDFSLHNSSNKTSEDIDLKRKLRLSASIRFRNISVVLG